MPIIGVGGVPAVTSWGFWTQPAVLVAQTYIEAISRSGGLPVVLPPLELATGAATEVMAVLDGLVLAGGTDVSPELYGEEPGPSMEDAVLKRDVYEVALAQAALHRDLPILGVCRGLQILNVATGGSLHQDLVERGYSEHRPATGRLDGVTNHRVEVAPTSLLARCGLAGAREVNSHHHQGVARIGRGGCAVAHSPDGVIEAVEWPEHRFVLGVQWHPEDPLIRELFTGLVDAARPVHAGSRGSRSAPPAPVPALELA